MLSVRIKMFAHSNSDWHTTKRNGKLRSTQCASFKYSSPHCASRALALRWWPRSRLRVNSGRKRFTYSTALKNARHNKVNKVRVDARRSANGRLRPFFRRALIYLWRNLCAAINAPDESGKWATCDKHRAHKNAMWKTSEILKSCASFKW